MKHAQIFFLLTLAVSAMGQDGGAQLEDAKEAHRSLARVVEIKTNDGISLKGTYFAAAKPGPGVLLLHQVNRTRESWNDVAAKLAAAGINALTVDMRGHGERGCTL